jgi:6-pyruvoyltetrahydropterin/6-carboxytetrahydropterin synthase
MVQSVFLTRSVRFSAAHRYYREEWSEQRNREVFGACSNPHGHGHNYRLHATVGGTPDPLTGFSVDLSALDRALGSAIGALDHQHLNHAIPDFAPGEAIPTTENLVVYLWNALEPLLPKEVRLVRLRLEEDVDLWVDYYGPAERAGDGFRADPYVLV